MTKALKGKDKMRNLKNATKQKKHLIIQEFEESIQIKKIVMENLVEKISEVAELIIETYNKGKKVVIFGNGGSAADAQHIACELVGRFKKERPALAAIALSTNTSNLTSIGNDYGYEMTFARQVEALAQKGDVVIGISTSGNATNVLEGIKAARKRGAKTIGFTGKDGGKLKDVVDLCIIVPSYNTPRIQEVHITIGHIICGLVERELFNGEKE